MSPYKQLSIELSSDPDDFAACAAMMCKTDPWITLGIDYEQCRKAFGGDYREVFLLEIGGQLAGFVIMQNKGTFKGYIQTLCIDEKYRGKGYGTRLIQFCEDRILQYSPNIFICVSSFNQSALRLYEKLGFELIGEMKNFIKTGFDELLLRKTVGPLIGYESRATKL